VSVSVGIAVEGKATSSATMIRNAESALYNAKQDRTGQVRVWDAEMLRQAQHRLSRQNGLRTALAAGELHIAYQPIVRLADRVIIGAEALLRWTHPDDGPIAPFDFIPIAERSGLIVPIGRWVMTQACGDIVGLNRVHGLRIAVNVAARQLVAGDFAQWVQEVIDGTGLPASALTVEVTEGALMEDLAPVRTAFACLRERGIKVAIDDFGTGYSSLARLQDLPVDVVKLDRAFVTDIVERPEARRMAAAILQLSTAINADIIAEGVETEEEAAVLEDLGYNSAQGYLFARPMPLAELTGLLESAAAR
jgi:EAL domain-containing protein (putative c-di-GMP-specific phosphodiesterase class I)